MTAVKVWEWADVRADIARASVTSREVAIALGMTPARFSTLLNSDEESMPAPAFVERCAEAIAGIKQVQS